MPFPFLFFIYLLIFHKSITMSTVSDESSFTPLPQMHIPFHQLAPIKLTENNYLMWRQQVLAAVKGYGLEGFLTGAKKCPELVAVEGDADQTTEGPNAAHYKWIRQDQLLVSWLLTSLFESLLVSAVGLETSKDIWNYLAVGFASQSRAKIMQYKQQLQGLRKRSLSMRDYLNKIKSCCDILNASGHKISDEDQVLYILSGLGTEYNPVMVNVSSRFEPLAVADVSSLLLSFEARLENNNVVASFSNDGSNPTVNLTTQ